MADAETGRRLAGARVEAGLTQEALAEKLGLNEGSQVSRIERGKVDPGIGLVRRWARACNVPIGRITGEVNRG